MGSVGGTAGTTEGEGRVDKSLKVDGQPSVLSMGFAPDGVFSYVTTTLFGSESKEPEQEDEIGDDAEAEARGANQQLATSGSAATTTTTEYIPSASDHFERFFNYLNSRDGKFATASLHTLGYIVLQTSTKMIFEYHSTFKYPMFLLFSGSIVYTTTALVAISKCDLLDDAFFGLPDRSEVKAQQQLEE